MAFGPNVVEARSANCLMECGLTASTSNRPVRDTEIAVEAENDTSAHGGGSQDGAIQKSQLLIQSFPPDGSVTNLTTLARQAGLAKSTTHRTLGILVETGMVIRTADGYRLGARTFEMAFSVTRALQKADLRDRLLPHLLDLYERTHQTVYLGILRHDEVICSQILYDRRGPSTALRQGHAAPASTTAAGHALLAYSTAFHTRPDMGAGALPEAVPWRRLFQVRRIGVAVVHASGSANVIEIAAPVLDANRRAVCAFAVSAPRHRLDIGQTSELVRRMADAAAREVKGALRERS